MVALAMLLTMGWVGALGPALSSQIDLSVDLGRAADGDGNGDVSAGEWRSLADSLVDPSSGEIDAARVAAVVLGVRLDRDGDGHATGAEVDARLRELDTDESGSLSRDELARATVQRGGPGAGVGGGAPPILAGMLGLGADADGNGELSAREWSLATGGAAAAGKPVPVDRMRAWMERLLASPPEGRDAYGPVIEALTLRADLDANHDGRRDGSDLDVLLARLDRNGDGAASAEELANARLPSAGGGGTRAASSDEPGVAAMPWQRNLEDALALSRASGKPLLVCVNMDGEPASDALASGRYRDPAFVKLVAGFVPVLASPDTHVTRERDGQGRRIDCSRFPHLLCSEHQAVEPQVFERWFGDVRVAPRHLGISPDGEILFDLYLLHDLSLIDRKLKEYGRPDQGLPDVEAMDDQALLSSPDALARRRLEQRFAGEPAATRRAWVSEALDPSVLVRQPELVFQGLVDPDPGVREAALDGLDRGAVRAPVELLAVGARLAWGQPDALDPIVAGLGAAAAAGDDHADRLARVLRAAAHVTSATVDVPAWEQALAGPPPQEPRPLDEDALYDWIGRLGDQVEQTPEDAELRTTLAGALLDRADQLLADGVADVSWLWESALDEARQASELPDAPPAAWAMLARASFYLGDDATAADAATRALPGLLPRAGSLLACDVLDTLVQSRGTQVLDALDGRAPWPEGWLADVVAGTAVLLGHPRAQDWQVASALDLIGGLELDGRHARLTEQAIARFPLSPEMHDQLRWHLLRDGDAADVLAAYDRLSTGADRDGWRWYAAYAALAAGDRLREERREAEAREVYGACLARFAQCVRAGDGTAADTQDYMGLAHAGLARLALADGREDEAASEMGLALATSPGCLDLPDGAGATPRQAARDIAAALRHSGENDRATALEQLVAGAEQGSGSGR